MKIQIALLLVILKYAECGTCTYGNNAFLVNAPFSFDGARLQCPLGTPLIDAQSGLTLGTYLRWLLFNCLPIGSTAVWVNGSPDIMSSCTALKLNQPIGLVMSPCTALLPIVCSSLFQQTVTSFQLIPSATQVTVTTFVSTTSTLILESISTITSSVVRTSASTVASTDIATAITCTTTTTTTVLTGTATVTLTTVTTLTEFRETTTVQRTTVTSASITGTTVTATSSSTTTRVTLTCLS